MDLSEDELVRAIRKVLSGPAPGVEVGIGDDGAVVAGGGGSTVLTTDMLVEGVHFERATISPRDLGAKSIVVSLSDVAAMAGSPRYALASLGITSDLQSSWVIELFGGMRSACDEYGLALVGGDTNRSDAAVISIVVVGEVAKGRAITRAGAHPGDLVVVTGSLGAAAGGLLLSRMHPSKVARALSAPWGRPLLDALSRPVARVGEGQTLAQAGTTAMIDLSDGFARDLSRLCQESGVGARIDLGKVPIADALRDGAPLLDVDPLELALGGGEDYELLATIDVTHVNRARRELEERFGVTLTEVGRIIETGLVAVDASGREAPLEPRGWDHFGTD